MRITVEGYKSILSPISISIGGLTLLSGANSSGKSSFMQPFLLLKQTLESDLDTGALLLDGGNVKLADSSEILSRIPGKAVRFFTVKAEKNDKEVSITYSKHKYAGLLPVKLQSKSKSFPNGLLFRMGMSHSEIASQLPEDTRKNSFAKFMANEMPSLSWKIVRKKCFLEAIMSVTGGKSGKYNMQAGISPAATLEDFAQNLIHVPGVRGNPERSYRAFSDNGSYSGSFEPYVANIIHRWITIPKYRKNYERLVKDLMDLGLASGIETARINDTRLEVKISRYKGAQPSDCVNIADVGFGVSQVLPVLVALRAAKKGQCVYIEQPELHLHPKAQHKLAQIILRAVNNDVRVIIETHSSILLRGIQTIVAKKGVAAEKISLNWFTQNEKTGETQVAEANLDALGAFGAWPSDFEEVGLEVESEYLDAVEEALIEKF